MTNKVVFLVFGMSPRIDRRINEFIDNGYEVDVYGPGSPTSEKYYKNANYNYNILFYVDHRTSYFERLKKISLYLDVVKKYNKIETIFYLFTLNVAVLAYFSRGLRFIYEESDMLFDRFKNGFLRKATISINKNIIKKSFLTVFTSNGFIDFYYPQGAPNNIIVIPNKVSRLCLELPRKNNHSTDFEHLRIGFAGNIRYQTILNVSDIVSERFPNYEFHYYGDTSGLNESQKEHINSQERVFIHGSYKYPYDLPEVYGNLDLIVCTYDVEGINPQYAEPNKLYEAIFYETPMIVSDNSYLSKKVEKLGIGISVDANDKEDIYRKISSITQKNYISFVDAMKAIPKKDLVNINDSFFEKLKAMLAK